MVAVGVLSIILVCIYFYMIFAYDHIFFEPKVVGN